MSKELEDLLFRKILELSKEIEARDRRLDLLLQAYRLDVKDPGRFGVNFPRLRELLDELNVEDMT